MDVDKHCHDGDRKLRCSNVPGEEQQPKLHKSSLSSQPTGFRCIAITIGFLADIRLYSQYIEKLL